MAFQKIVGLCLLAFLSGCGDIIKDEDTGNNNSNNEPRTETKNPPPSGNAVPNTSSLSGKIFGRPWKGVSFGVMFYEYNSFKAVQLTFLGNADDTPCGTPKRSWFDAGFLSLQLPGIVGTYDLASEEKEKRVRGTVNYYDVESDVDTEDYLSKYSDQVSGSITNVTENSISGTLSLSHENSNTEIGGTFVANKCVTY